MASDAASSGTARATPRPWHAPTSGTTAFAAALMMFGGAMSIFEGIAAIAKDDLFIATRHYVFQFSLAGEGWVHLILGIVLVAAGCTVLSGALWARFFGVTVAGLGVIANFLWVPYCPLWALTLVAVNVFIVWALCTGMRREAGDGRRA
ncbi:DUF7144 family membrane protein [Streptomyces chryseus]|uniref:DUF7144 domain-containing protein n=1 Tax=Streptomyces chryseus TaxID=68186 RepID=A0ABQ3EB90_9ACTN|nr:hypothetical protein GCM10010346_60900 [Streptomyces chryseus]